MTTQLIPRLQASYAVLLRPDRTALRASTAELWPILAIVVDGPRQPQVDKLFDGLDQGPVTPNLRSVWSIHRSPVPVLSLSIASDSPASSFRREVVVPALSLLDHLDIVRTARTAALTTSDRARHLTAGTGLRDALRSIMLIGRAPITELESLGREASEASADRQLQLAT